MTRGWKSNWKQLVTEAPSGGDENILKLDSGGNRIVCGKCRQRTKLYNVK